MYTNASGRMEPEKFLESVPPIVRSMHLVALIALTAAVLVLNGMVLYLAWKNRKHDAYAMANKAALATLDIAWAMLLNPIGFFSVASRSWPFGKTFCSVTGSLTLGVILLRNQLVGLALIDRFCHVFAPFSYPSRRRRVMVILAVAATLFAIIYPIPPALTRAAGKYAFYSAYAACFLEVSCEHSWCYGYLAVIVTHWTVFWAILPTVLILVMCIKAKAMSRAMSNRASIMGTFAAPATAKKNGNSESGTCSSRTSVENQGTACPDPRGSSSRAHFTFMLHVVIYVGCFLPIAIHFATYRTGFNDDWIQSELSTTIGFISGDIGLLLAVLDPLVTLTNKNEKASILMNIWNVMRGWQFDHV